MGVVQGGTAVVSVEMRRGPDGAILGFTVEGHAGQAPRGRDIVCAAVSALTQSAALGLEQRLGIAAVVAAGPGRFVCSLPPEMPAGTRQRADDILATMSLGIAAIARAYPRYVRLHDVAAAPVSVGSQ